MACDQPLRSQVYCLSVRIDNIYNNIEIAFEYNISMEQKHSVYKPTDIYIFYKPTLPRRNPRTLCAYLIIHRYHFRRGERFNFN